MSSASMRIWVLILLTMLLLAAPALAISPAEEARVETLLQALEQKTGTVFIRNGSEYGARDAAEHLRSKFRRAKSRLSSAEQFIDEVGSRSSMSGRDYEIREPGGQARPAGSYFHELLRQVTP